MTRGALELRHIVFSHLRGAKWRLALAALCLLGAIAAELAAPWPLKILFDNVLLGHPLAPSLALLDPLVRLDPWQTIAALAASISVLVLLGGGFAYVQIYLTARIGHELTHRLRRELFARLQRMPLEFHHGNRSGEVLVKFSADTAALKDLVADWALTIASHGVLLAGMIVIMLALDWRLALVVIATIPLLFAVLAHLNRRVRVSVAQQRSQEGRMASRVNEVLSSIAVVQAFGRQDYETERFETTSAQNLAEGIKASRATAAVSKSIALVNALTTSATIFVGAWQVLAGRMTPGELLVFMAYLRSLYKPLRDLGKLSVKVSRSLVSAGRIADLLGTESAEQEAADALTAKGLRGDIEFRHVSFAYTEGRKVLADASFCVRAGERVALVGASGTGKTTIVNLLLRLYERDSGAILIDRVDVRRYRRDSLREEIGIVLQDTLLFGASIRENISYGKPDATDAEIAAAARDAHADDFIGALPEGYDTIVGERGATLSGGQRQRICLARAIVKRPSILILDEPTSAIDPASAALIDETVRRLHAGRTLLVITHRLSSLRQFDRVLALKDGRIVERGFDEESLQPRSRSHGLV
jgi:ATP-binding cassette, subfamily B, bacterial